MFVGEKYSNTSGTISQAWRYDLLFKIEEACIAASVRKDNTECVAQEVEVDVVPQ